ncbi:unnamed protein product [Meloidogyne enterolobii]|uniref:Uncharacterized protein n=1 Tax=Meloidogyne enterolobii TaxID=390850 RepID=A0ACB1B4W2_MELEN
MLDRGRGREGEGGRCCLYLCDGDGREVKEEKEEEQHHNQNLINFCSPLFCSSNSFSFPFFNRLRLDPPFLPIFLLSLSFSFFDINLMP